MDDGKNFRAGLEAIMAARRDELAEPPSPEELLAYRDGTLPADRREIVEEKIAAFPDAARALLDLARFPDVEATADVRPVSDEEIAADWQTLRKRLPPAAQAATAAAAAGTLPAPPGRGLRWAASLAAAVALGAFAGLLLGRGPLAPAPSPTAGAGLVVLEPVGTSPTRSAEPLIAGAGPHVLILAAGDVEDFPAYALALHGPDGEHVLTVEAVAPTPEGYVTLLLPGDVLTAGTHRLTLSRPGGSAPLATFTFRVDRGEGR